MMWIELFTDPVQFLLGIRRTVTGTENWADMFTEFFKNLDHLYKHDMMLLFSSKLLYEKDKTMNNNYSLRKFLHIDLSDIVVYWRRELGNNLTTAGSSRLT